MTQEHMELLDDGTLGDDARIVYNHLKSIGWDMTNDLIPTYIVLYLMQQAREHECERLRIINR